MDMQEQNWEKVEVEQKGLWGWTETQEGKGNSMVGWKA